MRKFALVAGVVTAGLLGGCSDKIVGTARPNIDREDHFGIVLSQEQKDQLQHDTAFGPERQTRDEFGLLHVTVPVRSQIQHTLYLEYQYSFFDAGGRRLEGPMGWTPVTLEAGSPATVQFNSVGRDATLYQLVIRYQR